jgi:ribosome biogenesis GTPase
MSPIHDPDSPAGRRLTRLGGRIERAESADDAARRRKPGRGAGEPAARERPHLDAGDALEADWDELPLRERHGRRGARGRRRPVPQEAAADGTAPAAVAGAPTGEATVVGTARGPCEVELADGSRRLAELPKALARADRSELAVGDRVVLGTRPSGELVVESVRPRTSRLSRPDPFLAHRERVLVANLDLGIIVASLRRPPLATGLIDRFLVALAHGGVESLIAVNKLDLAEPLADDDPEIAALEPYRRLGVPIVLCAARTGAGMGQLRAAIAGRTVALVGHSGVGKSSLLNALVPDAAASVGEVSEHGHRGRHTTSRAQVYRLEGGARLVDTPGVREFGLWRIGARELAEYFTDLTPFAAGCRFADCSHRHEPDCAVRAAAVSGELAPERFATYLRMLDSLDAE